MILRWLNRSLKKLSEKRSYYSDTPGKFVLLKELKRKFLQIFFVDNFYFCSFVAENEEYHRSARMHLDGMDKGQRENGMADDAAYRRAE